MNKTSNTKPGQINWASISTAIADGVIPSPAGTDENGNPFWVFNGKRISWEQIQEYVLQVQKQKTVKQSSGRGVENIPQVLTTPERGFETGVETRVEQDIERGAGEKRETKSESTKEEGARKPISASDQIPRDSLIGQSPRLSNVDTTNPKSMYAFAQQNKNKPIDSSDLFLAEFLEKILQVLSIEGK